MRDKYVHEYEMKYLYTSHVHIHIMKETIKKSLYSLNG